MDTIKIKLISIVGKDKVLDSPDILESYARDESVNRGIKPWFVVKPRNPEQIQKLVAYANETAIPLVVVSSGTPHFRGDTVPTAPGAIMVDLSNMKKIIRIDRKNRIALIEPGVTYSQLQPALAKEGLRITTPLMPRNNKSVIASLLEREPTLVPKYNYALPEPLRCLEIVWGNGEMLRTGDSASYPSLERQWEVGYAQVAPTGPGQVDYHRLVSGAQGSMGIVTWASVKCEVLPKVHKFFAISANHLDDLIVCAYRILRIRFGDEFFILNAANMANILGATPAEIKFLKNKLPPWAIIIGIAGRDILPEEKVKFQEEDIRNIARESGLSFLSELPGLNQYSISDIAVKPSNDNYWKLNAKGACKDIFFLTTLDQTPSFMKSICSIAENLRLPIDDIGTYLQPQHQGTTCHCEFNLPHNPEDQAESAIANEFLIKSSETLINQGAYFSRPYGIWSEMVYNRDAANTWLLKQVKDIFDPHHILNPGKLCF